MDYTCGVFLFDKENKLLVCHPTNFPFIPGKWSIPKGIPDPGEDHRTAAIRELVEETSLIITPAAALELPPVLYATGKKTLQPFVAKLKTHRDELSPVCTSYVEHVEVPFPEVDQFEWVELEQAAIMLHESQARCLELVKEILERNAKQRRPDEGSDVQQVEPEHR
jgi:8-oxo-dGTP pyrophosphatase MutT (NUDIX family)